MTAPPTVVVAIPSVGLSPHLGTLVAQIVLSQVPDEVRLYDNSDTGELRRNGWPRGPVDVGYGASYYALVEMPGASLYAEWNDAAEWAAGEGSYLALLNDDVRLAAGTLEALAAALDADPGLGLVSVDWAGDRARCEPGRVLEAHGTYKVGGIAGWAFMVRPGAWQRIDERLRVWFGDDMLVHSLWANQWKVGRLTGVVAEHHASTTVNALPWVPEAIAEDTELWETIRRGLGA